MLAMPALQEKYGPDGTPVPELESSIIELASDIAAAEAVWLSLVAEFDRREGWAGHGVVSCAHWLSWRCGFSLSAAHDKVRVARVLTDLPVTSAAFERGELSYSRARAITRVATVDNEVELVDLARHSTGAQLERVVRAMSGVVTADEVRERAYHRHVSWHWDDDGSLVLSARLDPVEGAAVINAIEAAQAAELNKPRLPAESEEDVPAGAGDAAGPQDVVDAQDVADAPDVADADDLGDPQDALSLLSDDQGTAAAEIDEAALDGETAAEHAHEHGRQGTTDRADEVRETRVDAFVRVAESFIAATAHASGADVYQVVVHVGPDAAPHVEDGPALSVETALRLSCDASLYCVHEDADGNVLDVGRRTRSIPPAIRRALRQRDAGCCFPGCSRRRRVDGHHVRHWTRDRGPTAVHNLLSLCPRHHTLVHEGGFGLVMVEGQPVFSHPDGSPLPEVPERPGSTCIPSQWHRADVRPTAVESLWLGEPLDLGYVVAGLVRDRSHEAPARVSRHHVGREGTRCDSGVVPPL